MTVTRHRIGPSETALCATSPARTVRCHVIVDDGPGARTIADRDLVVDGTWIAVQFLSESQDAGSASAVATFDKGPAIAMKQTTANGGTLVAAIAPAGSGKGSVTIPEVTETEHRVPVR